MSGDRLRLFQLRRPGGDVPLQLLVQALTSAMTGPDPRALAVLEGLCALPSDGADLTDPDVALGLTEVARLFGRLPIGLRRRTWQAAQRLARAEAGRRRALRCR